ncbi:MAG: peptide chain release factor 2 [Clostridia bacterium]|nr:peptide chain release factor 2 [Clostridia bacterium]
MAGMKKQIGDLEKSLDTNKIKVEIASLEEKTSEAGFWNDQERTQKVLQRIKFLKGRLAGYERLADIYDDAAVLLELYEDGNDPDIGAELESVADKLDKEFTKVKLQTVLGGKHDKDNAIMTLHAGAGGTEAQDWVEMLLRMYARWAELSDFKFTITDILPGDEAGIKSVTARVEGDYAYGYLKTENGVHRLVRISPFDSSGRRHTSFASLEVIPEISDNSEINIRPEDLRVDTYRSSGAGGQHVNKTDSAIRLTHLPTGLVVSCQSERSQHQNRETAMMMLYSKLEELKVREAKDRIEDLKGVQMEIAWGSQIRSYVFCPYTMVKDHRTNYETGDVQRVMDGDIDAFINAFLMQKGGAEA